MMTCIAGERSGTYSGYVNCKCRCDECRSARREYEAGCRERKRTYYQERMREWREANPERVRELEKNRKPRNWKTEKRREQNRRYVEANREAVNERSRQWHRNNPEAVRTARATRRARQRNAFVETVVPQQVYERDNWVCHLCGMKINKRLQWPHPYSASIDHIEALANGGLHCYSNIAAAHLRCNLSKNDR